MAGSMVGNGGRSASCLLFSPPAFYCSDAGDGFGHWNRCEQRVFGSGSPVGGAFALVDTCGNTCRADQHQHSPLASSPCRTSRANKSRPSAKPVSHGEAQWALSRRRVAALGPYLQVFSGGIRSGGHKVTSAPARPSLILKMVSLYLSRLSWPVCSTTEVRQAGRCRQPLLTGVRDVVTAFVT